MMKNDDDDDDDDENGDDNDEITRGIGADRPGWHPTGVTPEWNF